MIAMAGSVESCDCLIAIYEASQNEIVLNSEMYAQYGNQIKSVVETVINDNNLSNLKIVIEDKGALDYTIKARLITALTRGGLI